jgi:hypothetical protein
MDVLLYCLNQPEGRELPPFPPVGPPPSKKSMMKKIRCNDNNFLLILETHQDKRKVWHAIIPRQVAAERTFYTCRMCVGTVFLRCCRSLLD